MGAANPGSDASDGAGVASLPETTSVGAGAKALRARNRLAAIGQGVTGALIIAAHRIRGRPLVATAPGVGLLLALTLVAAILQYSEAIAAKTLHDELAGSSSGRAPPGSIVLVRDPELNPEAADTVPLRGAELIDLAALAVGSQPVATSRHAYSIPLQAAGDFGGRVRIGFLAGLPANAVLEEGRWPAPASAESGAHEAVMMGPGLDALGLLVGDVLMVNLPGLGGLQGTNITVAITGRWQAAEPESPFWYFDPADELAAVLMMGEEDFRVLFGEQRAGSIAVAGWFAEFPAAAYGADKLDRQISNLRRLGTPGLGVPVEISLAASALPMLETARERLRELNFLLLAVAAPLFAAVVYYIAVAAGLGSESRASETTTMRSRGAGRGQVYLAILAESIMVGAPIAVAAPFLGLLIARAMGNAYGFLVLGPRPELAVGLAPAQFVVSAVGALAGAAVAATAAYQASSASAVMLRRGISRGTGGPIWKRLYLDIVLMAVASYLFWQLANGSGETSAWEPGMVIAPVILLVGAALASARVLPGLLGLLGWLLQRAGLAPEELAIRHLARGQGAGTAGFVIVAATVAMGLFLASAGSTLDRNDELRARFEVGADAYVIEGGPPGAPTHLGEGLGPVFDFTLGDPPPQFNLPADLHSKASGVESVARIWRGRARLRAPGAGEVRVLAVDPKEFAAAAWWQPDFAELPLATLARLLGSEHSALISTDLATDGGFGPGSQLTLRFGPADDGSGGPPFTDVATVVAGDFRRFPTHQPEEGPLVVLSLDQVVRVLGERPWDVMLRTDPGWDLQTALETFRAEGLPVIAARDYKLELEKRRTDSSRSGVFGLLSVGFIGALTLAVALFAYQAVLILGRRRPQVGILKAAGMTMGQLTRWLGMEFCLLAALATAGGTLAGAIGGWLGLRFLEAAAGGPGRGPDFEVVFAWGGVWRIALAASVAVGLALAVVLAVLSRTRTHEAIQLAEEQY